MQELSERLHKILGDNKWSQAQLARTAGVSQPSVSRALRGDLLRRGRARERLFKYAGIEDLDPKGTERVVAAFRRIWDKSEAHADAIARVIGALEGLGPKR